jgi:hypothetical protein
MMIGPEPMMRMDFKSERFGMIASAVFPVVPQMGTGTDRMGGRKLGAG